MQKHSWPLQPYKGFSYYTRQDTPLFAGREDDTIRCARFLVQCSTRILILHGSTGCGKSSFLRAGLIPFLESGDLGFHFIRSAAANDPRAVFVRSTDAPLCRLSECLYDFISRPLENMTPRGPQVIRLTEKITNHPDCSSFCTTVADNLDEMFTVLQKLARVIPQTLVIIIDQAEEVLTLKPGTDGQESRSRFFDFLTRFQDLQLDIKLLIAIRTEYIGRFNNEIQNRTGDIVAIPHYLLTDLTESRIVEAIERPTLQKDIGEYGSPYNFYNFSYEEGLAQRIAKDLLMANPRGGILPVLQIVCDRLHRSIAAKRHQADSTLQITTDDYLQLGGIEGQVDSYVMEMLAAFCAEQGLSSNRVIKKEIDRWKQVLYLLTREQLDGTATTQIKRADELKEEADKQFCQLDFDKTMKYLSDEKQRVIRREEITNIANGQRVECYSLGHDAIGLALHKWHTVREQTNKLKLRTRMVRGTKTCGRYISLGYGFLLAAFTPYYFFFAMSMLWDPQIKSPLGSLAMTLYASVVSAGCAWLCFYLSGFLPRIKLMIGSLWLKGLRKQHLR